MPKISTRVSHHADSSNTLALILAGGNGTRLGSLTARRPKPAVHVAGKFRCIDFAMSNCVHSGIAQIAVLTQYQSRTLENYLRSFWQRPQSPFGTSIVAWPSGRSSAQDGYQGTADAIRQNGDRIRRIAPSHVVVLAADHVYKMDYRDLLATHIENNADMTIGTVAVPRERAGGLGILTVDEGGRVTQFDEKPSNPTPIPGDPTRVCASMGIYVFDTEVLLDILERKTGDHAVAHDFGTDVIPMLMSGHRLIAHAFAGPSGERGYWRDIGTVDALWKTNMDAIEGDSRLALFDPHWPILGHEPHYPPAQVCSSNAGHAAIVTNALISNGCLVSGAIVEHSVLSYDVHLDEGSVVSDSVVQPHVRVGKHCHVRRAIVDANCHIPDGSSIGYDLDRDARWFDISDDGVVVVTSEALMRMVRDSANASLSRNRNTEDSAVVML